jgi:hypothetical protein
LLAQSAGPLHSTPTVQLPPSPPDIPEAAKSESVTFSRMTWLPSEVGRSWTSWTIEPPPLDAVTSSVAPTPLIAAMIRSRTDVPLSPFCTLISTQPLQLPMPFWLASNSNTSAGLTPSLMVTVSLSSRSLSLTATTRPVAAAEVTAPQVALQVPHADRLLSSHASKVVSRTLSPQTLPARLRSLSQPASHRWQVACP